MENFYSHDVFVINQKVTFFDFMNNVYKVFDERGEVIGAIQQEMSGAHKALTFIVSKQVLPFTFYIKDAAGQTLNTVARGATIWMSKVGVLDAAGQPVAGIKQKFHPIKPKFEVVGADMKPIAMIKGNWIGWDFTITGADGREIGTINKKWSGVMKEMFTNADNYVVRIDPGYAVDEAALRNKTAIVAAAVTIDMVLKQSGGVG